MRSKPIRQGRGGRLTALFFGAVILAAMLAGQAYLVSAPLSRPSDGALAGDADDALQRKLEELRERIAKTAQKHLSTAPPRAPHLTPPPPLRNAHVEYDPASVRPTRKSRPSTQTTMARPTTTTSASPAGSRAAAAEDPDDKPDSRPGHELFSSLETFYDNLLIEDVGGDPNQPSKSFTDIEEDKGRGVALPFDATFVEDPKNYEACDARNVSFSAERDALCQAYLANPNNMRFIKAMPSRLLNGRTIKMKIAYAHSNIRAIVKLSQQKFYYEAASEFAALQYDRALRFNRIPTSAYAPLPLDYLRAATNFSPLMSQWLHRAVVLFNYTSANFVECDYPGGARRSEIMDDDGGKVMCSMVATQLWIKDVHPAMDTFLSLPYRFDEGFVTKYYVPGHENFAMTKRARLRAIGELLDRFILDYIIGNSDRGMSDHNNFVYGGCSARTDCAVPSPQNRIKGLARYAFIDQGSCLYTSKDFEDNPFFSDVERVQICRFRKSTHNNLLRLASGSRAPHPLYKEVDAKLPVAIYDVLHASVLRKTQVRLDKVLLVIANCLGRYPENEVYSLPEYNDVRIAEEDETLDVDFD